MNTQALRANGRPSVPRWWGDAEKMADLVLIRSQCGSDRVALEAGGVRSSQSRLSFLLAWGRGDLAAGVVCSEAEQELATAFWRKWTDARVVGDRSSRFLPDSQCRAALEALRRLNLENET